MVNVADTSTLAKIFKHRGVVKYLGHSFPHAQTRQFIREQVDHWKRYRFGLWTLIQKEDQQIIGCCGLSTLSINDQAGVELIYILGKGHWGQGLATEAARASVQYGFERLRLDKIIALIDPQNVASKRVADKLGLRYVTTFQDQYAKKKGLLSHHTGRASMRTLLIDWRVAESLRCGCS